MKIQRSYITTGHRYKKHGDLDRLVQSKITYRKTRMYLYFKALLLRQTVVLTDYGGKYLTTL